MRSGGKSERVIQIEESNMSRYQIQPYRAGGWLLVEINSGLELIVFDDKRKAERACLYLNGKESRTDSRAKNKEEAVKAADDGR